MRLRLAVILFTCLLLGFAKYSPQSVPFAYDPNQVVGLLLGGIQSQVNEPLVIPITVTDPEGDPFVITQAGALGMMVVKEGEVWSLRWTPDTVGLYYCILEAEDIPADGLTSVKTYATVLINVMGANAGPVFEPFIDDVADSTMQFRYQKLKKRGTYILGIINPGEI